MNNTSFHNVQCYTTIYLTHWLSFFLSLSVRGRIGLDFARGMLIDHVDVTAPGFTTNTVKQPVTSVIIYLILVWWLPQVTAW